MFWLAIHKAIWGSISVVKVTLLARRIYCLELIISVHLSNIPHFEQLVFAIACHINAVTLGAHIRYTLCVTDKNADWPVARERSSIPHPDEGVIGAR